MSDQKFSRLISVLIAVTTVFAALLAQLEAEAGARDERAARDAKRASLAAFGEQVRGDAQSNYDYYTAFEQYRELEILREAAEDRHDDKAAARYESMAENLLGTSPLLGGKDSQGKPYFDALNEYEPDLARYQVETYYTRVQADLQRFKAASQVKQGWDDKANAYVFHLTLLAVALFLFGLAGTIATAATRTIFMGAGVGIGVLAMGLAGSTYLLSVPDLRQAEGAIEHYARGMGALHMDKPGEAVKSFDQALALWPNYADAYLERGNAYLAMQPSDLDGALRDYRKALELDPANTPVYLQIAFCLYQLGEFGQAVQLCRAGLGGQPDNPPLQAQMALALLAQGQDKEAQESYQKLLDGAAATVAGARAEGLEPPSEVLANLAEAASMLDELSLVLESGRGQPPGEKIRGERATVGRICDSLSARLVSWEMALEDTGKPPRGGLSAKLIEEEFLDTSTTTPRPLRGEVFAEAPRQVSIGFHYDGMKKGQTVIYRTFLDGEELDSWRYRQSWTEEGSGDWDEPLYPGYSESFAFEAGHYDVEVFIDYQLAASGSFDVAADEE